MSSHGSFLEGYVKLCDETEAPRIFGLWCGVAAISAALGRNSFLQFGQFPIYPNFYIIIVGSSGLYRKSTSIEIASSMLHALQPPPRMISQKVTPEALIQAVRKIETDNPLILLKESGTAYVVADEFNVFLNKKSYEAGLASLLIQMFDCKDEISYQTVGRGVESVRNACLGILGGSTVDWLKGGIPEEAVGGGLTSRMVFVYYDGVVKDIPWPEFSPVHQQLKQDLTAHLQEIAQINGEFKLDASARKLYEAEYIKFRNFDRSKGGGKDFFYDMNLRGYASRRHIHMLKLSMVFSASERYDRVITEGHLLAGIAALQTCEEYLPKIISQITSTSSGTNLEFVLNKIRQAGELTRTALQRSVANRLDKRQLDEVLDTLTVAGLIQLVMRGASNVYVYSGDK
jgi:hypothetical protein